MFLFLLTSLFLPILCVVVLIIVILASLGKSIGIRRAYVRFLLRVFEWCGQVAKRDAEKKRKESLIPPSPSDSSTDLPARAQQPRDSISSDGISIIKREATERIVQKLGSAESFKQGRVWTLVDDNLDFIKAGLEAIIEDEVTNRFVTEELPSWNLLTRTSAPYRHLNWKLGLFWGVGMFVRYFLLFPGRLMLQIIGMTFLIVGTAAVGYVKDGPFKKWLNWHVSLICNRIVSHSVSAIITYHNKENRAQCGGICVANHTSPIDVMTLSCDCCFAMIGQKQGGILGVIQRAQNRASDHIWFERSEANDRSAVTRRIKEHTEAGDKLPILIFPEGTCINNTSVMMFKKGSFEVGARIYPVAIKYDSRFGDPFWNSSEQGWGEYMISMMTSWAIVADVWYLPPMDKRPDEDGIAFATRVKKVICAAGGLVDLEWDGQLKRYPVSAKMIAKQQQLYWQRLNRVDSKEIEEPVATSTKTE